MNRAQLPNARVVGSSPPVNPFEQAARALKVQALVITIDGIAIEKGVDPLRDAAEVVRRPRAPQNLGAYDAALAELSRRTGHTYEIGSNEREFFVFDLTVGDAAGEGASAREALESALENI